LLEGSVKEVTVINSLKLLNCYVPYTNRDTFWESLKDEGLFNEPNFIVGGDLNFTTPSREVWGDSVRSDPLQFYFSQLIQEGDGRYGAYKITSDLEKW